MASLFIVAAKRTPFGTFGGKLKAFTATDLAVHAAKAALAAGGVDPAAVGSSVVGNVAQTSSDAAYCARHVGLKAGLKEDSTAVTVNRLCGSGFDALANGAREILLGDNATGLALVGGTESMSQAPLSAYGHHVRFGHRLGVDLQLTDSLWAALTDSYAKTPMGITAENLGAKFGITREQCDAFALQSQQRWAAAQKAGVFGPELAPMELPGKKGPESFAADEHPRPDSTLASLQKLPPVFKKDGGLVTAGSASGICDGAAMMVLASEAAVKAHKLKPLARVAGWTTAGCDPKLMGYGPVPAIRALLKKAGVKQEDVGLYEINEAFAAQALACAKELGLPEDKLNVHGGAIALGHPLGASGARITSHLAHQLAAPGNKHRWAVGSACIGGGQGMAVLLERV